MNFDPYTMARISYGFNAQNSPYSATGPASPGAAASRPTDTGITESTSPFRRLLNEKLNNSVPQESRPTDTQPSPRAEALFALSQRIKLQLTNSLLNAFRSEKTPEDSLIPLMGTPYDLFPPVVTENGSTSTIQRHPSENKTRPPQEYADIIQQAAATYEMDPDLITGVIHAESSFNPNAQSPKGAMGLMQLMPQTAKELGVTDPFDPMDNIMGGTRYLKRLMDRYQGDMPLALAAYNWGMGNVETRGDRLPTETKNYIRKITAFYNQRKTDVG